VERTWCNIGRGIAGSTCSQYRASRLVPRSRLCRTSVASLVAGDACSCHKRPCLSPGWCGVTVAGCQMYRRSHLQLFGLHVSPYVRAPPALHPMEEAVLPMRLQPPAEPPEPPSLAEAPMHAGTLYSLPHTRTRPVGATPLPPP
jgi:hypothetical protein